jgi:hypothetical protein
MYFFRIPGLINVNAWAENVNPGEAPPVNVQDHVLQEHGFPEPLGPKAIALIGSLAQWWYFDCLDSNSFVLAGLIKG